MRHILTLVALLTLAGCGGGGGGGSTEPPPVSDQAVNDAVSTSEESSVTINVLANDVAVNTSTLAINSQPANGSVSVSGSSIEYTPNENFSGTDSFRYQVTGNAGSQLTATVTITVQNVNDAQIGRAHV